MLNYDASSQSTQSSKQKLKLDINKQSELNQEISEKYNENEELSEKLEENENAYEIIKKEVDTLTTDFENIESEKVKALTEVVNIAKKKQDLEYKLNKREDELKLVKSQIAIAKKSFSERLIEIKKKFGSKLVEFGTSIYPNIAKRDKIVLNNSFVQSKGPIVSDEQFQSSILRISQLVSTKPDIKEEILTLRRLEQVENINDLINLHSRFVEQITELVTENRILKMQVIESDYSINQENLV